MDNYTNKNIKQKEQRASTTVIISSLAYLVLGFIMVIYPQAVGNALCYILGSALTVYGLFNIISFFRSKEYNMYFEMVVGVIATAFGIFSLISPQLIVKMIFSIIGIVIIIDSIIDIKHSFLLKSLGMKNWWICFAVSAAVIILGGFTILFPEFFGDFILILLGTVLIYEGISGLTIALLISRYTKENNKRIIDAKFTDVD